MGVNGVNNFDYTNFMFNSYTNKKKDNFIEQMGKSYSNYINISSFGSSLNSLYNDLKNISNESERSKALEGARDIIINFAKNSNGLELARFTDSLNKLKETDNVAFNKLFVEANDLNSLHYNVGKWANTFSNLYDTGFQKEFISETDTILKNQAQADEKVLAMNNFVDSIDKMLNAEFPKEDMLKDSLSGFFKGLDNFSTLAQKNDFMNDYVKNSTKGIA